MTPTSDGRRSTRAYASSKSGTSTKTAYVCAECGEDARQWLGQCPACKTWDSMKPIKIDGGSSSGGTSGKNAGGSGEKGSTKNAMPRRRLLGGSNEALGSEIERVLGGGVVPGGMTLVGGDPGVGKSTILLQLAGLLAESGGADAGPVLYASGEESVEQVGGRAERMGLDSDSIYLYSATRLENVLEAVATLKPSALVVDSIQTVFLEDATGSPGSVSQVRECATALLHAAKTTGIPVFIIGHVTKSGDIAGPRVLEHIVDVVLYLEGDADRAVRILRGHKNRYGSTDEVGVFQMSDEGMKPRILSPDVSAAPTVTVQGSRPFMLEVQALTNERADEGQQAPPIRTAVGLRFERMQLILAVLAKFVLGRRVQKHDIFINILEDPSTDVAVALAIASSFVEKALPADMAFFGEVGLGGELRPVMQAERRIAEAAAMGFKRVLLPESGSSPDMGKKTGIELVRCNTVAEALEATLERDSIPPFWVARAVAAAV
ncbi:P-loop containing nucleoside triphosphate hydrolase protein [Ostreococcus tauri]|uniref:P-loop containing nucleoside triphosphate hydrolase protein n=1 Tax=Ostreococcus tauri TaxID=70448 RepID=A0A1Y5I9K7_OSTTA|nr:P-loop containing nucleoside triphosphate hydrolase protein [Ostreococcus tauri]